MNFMRANQNNIESSEKRVHDLENELATTRTLLLAMADSAYNALIVLNDQCEIVVMNEQAKRIFEYEHPVGQALQTVTGSQELTMMVSDSLANQEEMLEEQIWINDHAYRVRVQIIQRTDNDDAQICLAMEDVTELIRLNRARRDMVGNISHELRTPIANIRLIIDGLFHETEKPKRKQSIYSLRAIARETDALLWMAEELLDLSMIESGQAIMKMYDSEAFLIVEDAIDRVYDQSAAKEIEVVHDVPETLYVLCDQDKIRRVLVNLIHNAVKWSPPGETISIHAQRNDEEVTISVFDNGPGVPEEQTGRIFERFYQADESRSVSEGTGLGLAICKHIVEAHGGRIWAESNANQGGGRFSFTLPVGEAPHNS